MYRHGGQALTQGKARKECWTLFGTINGQRPKPVTYEAVRQEVQWGVSTDLQIRSDLHRLEGDLLLPHRVRLPHCHTGPLHLVLTLHATTPCLWVSIVCD